MTGYIICGTQCNEGAIAEKLLRVSRWRQESINYGWDPIEHGALCDYAGHTPMKLALVLII